MRTIIRNADRLLAVIMAMGKDEFLGEPEEALNELFRDRLELIDRPEYLRYTPGKLTFESALNEIFFGLGVFSWTYEHDGCHGSYYTHYRLESGKRQMLELMVAEARQKNPELIGKLEALAPEFERLMEKTVEERRALSIAYDPTDVP